jgi:hypothetical protein
MCLTDFFDAQFDYPGHVARYYKRQHGSGTNCSGAPYGLVFKSGTSLDFVDDTLVKASNNQPQTPSEIAR